MNELEFVTEFIDNNRQTLNPQLFQRDDWEIVEELKNVILSCQRDNPYFIIKVEGFRVIDDYAEINRTLERYYEDNGGKKKVTKGKKKENIFSLINVEKSAIRLLEVKYYIHAEGGKEEETDMRFPVLIAVPRVVDKYYCLINGIKRSMLYQIVDGSTYNNNTSSQKSPVVTMKTIFMATRIYKYYMDLELDTGETIKSVNYVANMFSKRVQAPKYIFAKYGFYGALDFFGIHDINVTCTALADERYYSFKKADGYFISVPKILFDSDNVVQSIVSMLYNSIIAGMPYEMIFTREYWLRSLGADFNGASAPSKMLQIIDPNDNTIQDTLPKGYSVLDSFESVYDLNGKNIIKLPDADKADMYCILRWLLREFNKLRLKDNLDISIKRIRFAEYIASIYAMKVVKGIYRVADMNKRANCKSIVKALRTDPMFLLTAISRCGMAEYRNMTSDMDALLALKFTFKGVSGLGENNSQTIPQIYRYIHPSHIGRVDVDASSDSDPGMKGIISPFAQISNGGYFEDQQEPNEWESQFADLMAEWERVSGLIEPLEFQNKVLGIDNTDQINMVNEVSCTAKQIIKPYINQAIYNGQVKSLEDLTYEEILCVFGAGDEF